MHVLILNSILFHRIRKHYNFYTILVYCTVAETKEGKKCGEYSPYPTDFPPFWEHYWASRSSVTALRRLPPPYPSSNPHAVVPPVGVQPHRPRDFNNLILSVVHSRQCSEEASLYSAQRPWMQSSSAKWP